MNSKAMQQVVNNAKKLSSVISSNGFRIVSGGTIINLLLIYLEIMTGDEIASLLRKMALLQIKMEFLITPPKLHLESG